MIRKLPLNTRKKIAARIKEAREKDNCTVTQLADICGFTKSYVSQLERASVTPSLATLFDICDALHTKVADLLDGVKK